MSGLRAAERGIWLGHSFAADRALYNTAEALVFSGKVEAPRLAAAVRRAVLETDVLRSNFRAGLDGGGERVLVTLGVDEPPLPRFPLGNGGPLPDRVRAWARARDLDLPFDLGGELPCRFALLETEDVDVLYMAAHHIALDGYGYALFWKRVAALYSGEEPAEPAPAAVVDAPNADDEARAFWRARLATSPEAPSFDGSDAELTRDYAQTSLALSDAVWRKLAAPAGPRAPSWADTLVAVVAALARLYSGSSKQILGLPVLNRLGDDLRIPCMQMNIVPLRVPLLDGDDLTTLAAKVAAEKTAARPHQHLRHEAILSEARAHGPRDRLFGPVVNILPFATKLRFGGADATTLRLHGGPVADLTFTLHYVSRKEAPWLELSGNARDWPPERLASAAARLVCLLEIWLDAPATTLGEVVEQVLAAERREHLIGTSPTLGVKPRDFIEAFVELARRHPDRVAVEHDGRRSTYGALLARAEAWAGALRRRGVGSGTAVGVVLPRSLEAIVALVAILHRGATYVPLDPASSPEERATRRIQAGVDFVIGPDELRDLDSGEAEGSEVGDAATAAYVLFTSGSTGSRKGVVVSRGALGHFIEAANERYRVVPEDRVLQFAPLTFDASLEEITVTLAHGACLVLRTDPMLAAFEAFSTTVEALGVTVLDLPTAFWNSWVEALRAGATCLPGSVRLVILGGEAVHPATLARWFELAEPPRLVNSYGPTEATIVATTCDLLAAHASLGAAPIGTPLTGVSALVVGAGGLPEAEGELLILGPTVAAGYARRDGERRTQLGDGELRTWLRVGDAALPAYRTGDRVAWRDGALVFLGRMDDAFKIAGHRAEPREIEAELLRIAGIVEACVLGTIDGRGRRRIVAFVAGREVPPSAAIKSGLAPDFPRALLPRAIRIMESLPKTAAGKVDRAALAAMVARDPAGRREPVEASVAARVKAAWRATLDVETVADEDDFFRLGGESLQMLQLALDLSLSLGKPVSVADVLRHPVLADFCTAVGEAPCDEAHQGPAVRLVDLDGARGGTSTYVFPGLGGESAAIVALGRILAQRGEAYLVESLLATSLAVDQVAAACSELIATRGCDRKVRLVGHSLGGCVAFESARRLRARGLDVDLVLLDTFLHLDREDLGSRYRPSGAFDGRARLVYAQDVSCYPSNVLEGAKARDAALFIGPCDVRLAPGDHHSMLSGARVERLAEQLQWV